MLSSIEVAILLLFFTYVSLQAFFSVGGCVCNRFSVGVHLLFVRLLKAFPPEFLLVSVAFRLWTGILAIVAWLVLFRLVFLLVGAVLGAIFSARALLNAKVGLVRAS